MGTNAKIYKCGFGTYESRQTAPVYIVIETPFATELTVEMATRILRHKRASNDIWNAKLPKATTLSTITEQDMSIEELSKLDTRITVVNTFVTTAIMVNTAKQNAQRLFLFCHPKSISPNQLIDAIQDAVGDIIEMQQDSGLTWYSTWLDALENMDMKPLARLYIYPIDCRNAYINQTIDVENEPVIPQQTVIINIDPTDKTRPNSYEISMPRRFLTKSGIMAQLEEIADHMRGLEGTDDGESHSTNDMDIRTFLEMAAKNTDTTREFGMTVKVRKPVDMQINLPESTMI